HRSSATLALDVACPAQPHTVLEAPEVGATAGPERDDLAVEDAVGIDAVRQFGQFGIGPRHVLAVAAGEDHFSGRVSAGPLTVARARIPSHFISNAQSSASRRTESRSPMRASIGWMSDGRIPPFCSLAVLGRVFDGRRSGFESCPAMRWIIQFFSGSLFGPLSPVLNRANRRTPPSPPSSRPWRTAMISRPSSHFSTSTVPASQIETSPAPYWPLGIRPSK